MEVIDVAKADIDVEAILFGAVIFIKHMRLVGLRRCLVARYLDQPCHFDEHGELTITGRQQGLLNEILEEVLGHRCCWLVDELNN